jgi:peptidyl-tRNA hydrolase
VQSNHATADFAYEQPHKFREWKETSNYIISLQIPDENQLILLYEKLKDQGAYATLFREPDIDNEATSFAVFGTPEVRKQTSNLKLSLKKI